MSAKEEHARNVEIHKMTRLHNETSKKNIALEAECAKLRIATKDAFDKCATMRETMSKQYADKMNEIQLEFENEKKRLNEQAQKDISFQRARHLDSVNDIKRQLETMYANKINENNATHEAFMQELKKERELLNEERERSRMDAEEQLAQLAQDRRRAKMELEEAHQLAKQELDELHERIKRDEQDHVIRLVLEMDSDREKMKCQLKEERNELVKQLDKEDMEKRKKHDDEMAEMKRQAEAEHTEKMNKVEAEFQRANDEWDKVRQKQDDISAWHRELEEQFKKKEEEQIARHNETIEELKKMEEEQIARHNERAQYLKNAEKEQLARLKQKEEEQHQRFLNDMKLINDERALMNEELTRMNVQFDEERERIKRNEHEHQVQFLTQMKLEREKMKCQLERERQLAQNDAAAERELNAQTLEKASQALDDKFNARVAENRAEHNLLLQKLNQERDQIQHHVDELCEKKKQWELESSKMKARQLELKEEKERVAEQAKKDAELQRRSNEEALAEKKRENDERFAAILTKQREAFDEAMRKLNDTRDELKEIDLRREKEHTQSMKQMKIDIAADIKSNADALAKAKQELETKFNAEMQQLNEERQQIQKRLSEERERNKRDNLEREKLGAMQLQLEKDRVQLFEQAKNDAAAQRKSNMDALAQTKLEYESRFNAMVKEQNDTFNAAMKKLNEEREQLKRDEIAMNASLRKKMQELHEDYQREKNKLIENMQKENELQLKNNADVLAEQKREQDAQSIAMANKRRIEFEAAMRKLNDDRAKFQIEHELLLKNNVDVLAEQKREQDAQSIAMANKQRIEFEAAMRKLNDDRRKSNDDRDKMQKEHELQLKHNADVLAEQKREQDAQFNAMVSERRITFEAAMRKLNDDRDELKETDLRREKEHMQLMKQVKIDLADDIKSNADKLAQTILTLKQQFNEERIRLTAELETSKMRDLQLEFDNEREQFTKEKMRMVQEKRKMEEEMRNIRKQMQVEFNHEREQMQLEFKNEREQMQREFNNEREQIAKEKMRAVQDKRNMEEEERNIREQLHDVVAENATHMQLIYNINFKDKRVAIYSHYSASNEVESYNMLTVEGIRHYFDYIIVLTNCPNKWNMHSPNHNKIYLLNYNMKSDFRNYGVFIMQTELSLRNASCMCLVNDSFVVVDVNAFGRTIKRIFNNELASYDFIGLTSSYENVFHMQSFFLHFNASTLNHVMDYFKTQGLPDNHDGAISKYELGISMHLIDNGFSQFSFVSNNDMKYPLNTTCVKWSEVLNVTGIIKRQHFFKRYAYKSMTDRDISDVAEKYSYNKHFIHFLKYNNIRYVINSNS